jgi:hypothetical protein
MAKKISDIGVRVNITFSADYEIYERFKKIVGEHNASKELRAMIKQKVLTQECEKPSPRQVELLTKHNPKATTPKVERASGSYEPVSNYIRNNSVFETSAIEISSKLAEGIKAV